MGSLKGRSGEILECRLVDICCALENRFRRKSVRMISYRAAEYKLFWIRNEKGLGGAGIFLFNKKGR